MEQLKVILFINNLGLEIGWPINSSSVSMWVKESDWSDNTNVFKMESGDNSDKDLFYSEGGVWKRKLNAHMEVEGYL